MCLHLVNWQRNQICDHELNIQLDFSFDVLISVLIKLFIMLYFITLFNLNSKKIICRDTSFIEPWLNNCSSTHSILIQHAYN
jgi:hypothetical protein